MWSVAWSGWLIGVLLTTYTGYYLLAAVVGMVVIAQAWWSDGWQRAATLAIVFAAAAASVVAVMELIFRTGGLSYLANVRAVHRDIASPSDDGWLFLPEYLLMVERLSGAMLLVGAVAYFWRAGVRAYRRTLRPIDCVLWPALLAWAVQAASSAEWQAIPLYGRLLHPWMPFLAWALADTIAGIDRDTVRSAACVMAVATAIVSWAPAARVYYRLAYPSNVLYDLGIDTTRLSEDRLLCELNPGTWYASPGPLNRATGYPYTRASNYVLLNFCQALMAVPRPRRTEEIRKDATLIYDGPHWMTFPAYTFEGLTHEDRAAMTENDYRVRAFRLEN
jgi:hypothetical protein